MAPSDSFPVILTALFSFISNVWTSEVEEIEPTLEIRVLLRLSNPNLSLSGPSDGSGDTNNDKDENDDRSAKHSFDQFNADELAEEQASNRIGGANDDGDLSVSCIPFRIVFINSRVGFQGPNRMEGTDDADDFGESEVDEPGSALLLEFAIFADFAVTTECGSSEHLRALATRCDRSSDGIAIRIAIANELRSAGAYCDRLVSACDKLRDLRSLATICEPLATSSGYSQPIRTSEQASEALHSSDFRMFQVSISIFLLSPFVFLIFFCFPHPFLLVSVP